MTEQDTKDESRNVPIDTTPEVTRIWKDGDVTTGLRLSDEEAERIQDALNRLSKVHGVRRATQIGLRPLREIHVQQLHRGSKQKLFNVAYEHGYVPTKRGSSFGWSGTFEQFVTDTDFQEHYEHGGDDVVTWVLLPAEHTDLFPEYDHRVLKERAEQDELCIEIVAVDVGGERRVEFDGVESMKVDDAILREESDEAWQRFAVEDVDDGSVLGCIVLENGEYDRTEWNDSN